MSDIIREDGGVVGTPPANNTGSGTDGAIKGLGGKDGEPPGPKSVMGLLRRKKPVGEGYISFKQFIREHYDT